MENSRTVIFEIAQLLRFAQYAVVFTGAGISTPSGIPDFRSPECGLWANVDPMTVASLYGFRQNPRAFYDWVYPLARTTLSALPNPAHEALARLEQRGIIKAVVTQNIDTLHTRAGSQRVFELHGHLREATCIHCFRVYPGEEILLQFLEDRAVPQCPSCGGVIKPNVILFGEQLPHEAYQASREAARRSDLMIVVGSSLEVAPASDIPLLAAQTGARLVIINRDPTPFDRHAALVVHGDAAHILPEIADLVEAQ
jgi:NAD-dependent deacetylase